MTLTRGFALFLTVALASAMLHADAHSRGTTSAVHLTAISARVTAQGRVARDRGQRARPLRCNPSGRPDGPHRVPERRG